MAGTITGRVFCNTVLKLDAEVLGLVLHVVNLISLQSMEKQVTVGRISDTEQEQLSESDVSLLQVAHLYTHGPVRLLPASDQGETVSMDRVARPAPRTTLPDSEDATGLKEMETFYISPQRGYLDTDSGQVGD